MKFITSSLSIRCEPNEKNNKFLFTFKFNVTKMFKFDFQQKDEDLNDFGGTDENGV